MHQKKDTAMRNTDYSLEILGNLISNNTSFQALQDLISDLGLEMEDALAL